MIAMHTESFICYDIVVVQCSSKYNTFSSYNQNMYACYILNTKILYFMKLNYIHQLTDNGVMLTFNIQN